MKIYEKPKLKIQWLPDNDPIRTSDAYLSFDDYWIDEDNPWD